MKRFVGTHSFHNYASSKGRQLKEVRKRVQASIDLKKTGGGGGVDKAAGKGGDGSSASPGLEEGVGVEGGGAGEGDKKRERPRDDWRTYRHQKKSAAGRKEEDDWYGKKSKSCSKEGEEVKAIEPVPEAEKEAGVVGGEGGGSGVPLSEGTPAVGSAQVVGEEAVEVGDAGVDADADAGAAQGGGVANKEEYEGPEKVLLLRELRTRCVCATVDNICCH